MATPNAAKRRKLAAKGEANKDGSYPTDTRGRAVAAKGRATDAVKAGRMSKSAESKIDKRANRKLGKNSSAKTSTGKRKSWTGA